MTPAPALDRRTLRTIVAVAVGLSCVLLPVFLTGALAGPIGRDLGLDEAGVGVALTGFFLAAALASTPAGRLADRLGPARAIVAGTTVSTAAAVLLAGSVRSGWQLTVLLAVAGTTVGLVDTGGARAFAESVSRRRHGIAFGLKEASVPAAAMLAGLVVPLAALAAGWRPTFLAGLLLAPLAWLLLPRGAGLPIHPPRREDHRHLAGAPPLRLALAAALGGAASTPIATFLVPGATAAGLSATPAGLLLAVSSAVGLAVRVGVGWQADRTGAPATGLIQALMLTGAGGLLLLASGGAPLTVLGALLGLGAGWGWTGLVFLAAVRARPDAPAAAAGVTLTGLGLGGAAGPALFGVLVSRVSWAAGWSALAALMLLGAAVLAVHRRTPARGRHVTAPR